MPTPLLLDYIYCKYSFNNIFAALIFYDIRNYNPVIVMIPKNKVSPGSRPPREIRTKTRFFKIF